MEAEALMLQKTSPTGRSGPLRDEALAWARLFDHRYIDRTLVGVVVMFFQREHRGTFTFGRLLSATASQNGVASMP